MPHQVTDVDVLRYYFSDAIAVLPTGALLQ